MSPKGGSGAGKRSGKATKGKGKPSKAKGAKSKSAAAKGSGKAQSGKPGKPSDGKRGQPPRKKDRHRDAKPPGKNHRKGQRREVNRDQRDQAPATLVGVIRRKGRFDSIEPIFSPGPVRTVDSGGRNGVKTRDGDLVLLADPAGDRSGRVRVERVIGRPDNPRDVIEALMLDRGISRGFPAAVEAEAEQVAQNPPRDGREDLRELVTFTVDPTSAKDFDDAISAEDLGNGTTRIWVHIADVSAFVRPGTLLDEEARRRSTSVYVPGAVEPMLPHSLSSGQCSLLPLVERLAVTIEMDFRGADVVASRVIRSVIRSDMRLDYDEVDRIFSGEIAAREPWAAPLAAARQVSKALEQRRMERHGVALDRPEPEFQFDREGMVSGWKSVDQTESHRLIEMLMVAANSQVAKMLVESRSPALHRVHEKPDSPSVELLLSRLESLDIPTPPAPKTMTPQQAEEIASKSSVLVDHWTRKEQRGRLGITTLVLRALQQARYDSKPVGHSGLGLEHYCHFTSPIRRYPDIVCHRAILAALGLGEEPPSNAGLSDLAEWTSAREREAMKIERSADDIASCFLLVREIELAGVTRFDGEVVGIIPAGVFVDFGGGFEGFLPVRRMRGSWWEANAEQTMLIADEGGKRIRLGDPIKVDVGRVDAPRGRCDLYPVPERD